MSEQWKDIKGYEGIYQISNMGRVKSLEKIDGNGVLRKEMIRKLNLSPKGYNTVALCKDRKYKIVFVHRLVAEAFIPNPNNMPYVNHIDENKTNNVVKNLEWCDVTYNNNYGHRNLKVSVKLGKPVVSINIKDGKEMRYHSINEASRQTGISRRKIWHAINEHFNCRSMKWMYAEDLKNERY